jgi:hypothetical protein
MHAVKTVTAVVLAGALALPLWAGRAEARDGRNAAIVGGVVLGALAGAAIANAADAASVPYEKAQWVDDGYDEPNYYDQPYYTYRRHQPAYIYVQPAPQYRTYDYGGGYRRDWRWHHPHPWWRHRPAYDGAWGDY